MKNRSSKKAKVIVMAAMALIILFVSIPASASELAMLTGDSAKSSAGQYIQPKIKVKSTTDQNVATPVEFKKSLKDIFEVPSHP